jgi:hypothetical protein
MAKPYARDLSEHSACPKKICSPFTIPTCSNSLFLRCILIAQMAPPIRDTLQNAKTWSALGARGGIVLARHMREIIKEIYIVLL